MITLYQKGGGSSECELCKPVGSPETWIKLRTTAVEFLRAQSNNEAADILESGGFELFEATNGFGDEFFALSRKAKVAAYADCASKVRDEAQRVAYVNMASVFAHLGFSLRFIVVELDDNTTGVEPVGAPISIAPVEIVIRALRDAQQLLATTGAVSAIDRVHTALHGYLKWVCEQAGSLPATKDPSVTELFKAAGQHPKLLKSATHSEKIEKILRAFASALDAVNQVRNRGSMAHANEDLVDEADAMLVVNAARTILRYLDDRLNA